MNKQILFKDLNFPKAMNLDYLLEAMAAEKVKRFISVFAHLPKAKRTITLPSEKCIRKALRELISW